MMILEVTFLPAFPEIQNALLSIHLYSPGLSKDPTSALFDRRVASASALPKLTYKQQCEM